MILSQEIFFKLDALRLQFLAVLHAFAEPADFKFPQDTKVGRTVGGVTSIEGQPWFSRYFCLLIIFCVIVKYRVLLWVMCLCSVCYSTAMHFKALI